MRATQAIINLNHLKDNFNALKKLAGSKTLICCCVKANAYGHGAVEVAKALSLQGAHRLAVATVTEAAELRRAGITLPIHLLSLCLPSEYLAAVKLQTIPFVCSLPEANLWQETAKKANLKLTVHLKVDTGMGRIGCTPQELNPLFTYIKEQCPNLLLEGLASHFACADDNPEATQTAYNLFEQLIETLPHPLQIYHTANSAASLTLPQSRLNMIRPGLILYGYSPLKKEEPRFRFKPVLKWTTHIIFIKKVLAGSSIGYGATYTLKEDSYIATLPVGYADGYARSLSNKASVLINDTLYPVVGNICMDQLMVNLGPNTKIKLYAKVILMGYAPPAPTAETLAQLTDTISYEILTNIAPRVPRIIE